MEQRNSQMANRKNAIFPFCVTFAALLSCVCPHIVSPSTPLLPRAHTITIQGSRCQVEEEEEKKKTVSKQDVPLARALTPALFLTLS